MTTNELTQIAYTTEQQSAIDLAVAEAVSTRGVEYSWSDRLVERGAQMFAVFGGMAREIWWNRELTDDHSGEERNMYELYDSFRRITVSRHRTLEAVGREAARITRAIHRRNGPSAYFSWSVRANGVPVSLAEYETATDAAAEAGA